MNVTCMYEKSETDVSMFIYIYTIMEEEELLLDPAIRDWVVIPIIIMVTTYLYLYVAYNIYRMTHCSFSNFQSV